MPRLHYSDAARSDLYEIAAHIAEDSQTAAGRVVANLERACLSIAQQPGIGRKRPDLAPDLNGFPVGNYVIFYEKTGDVVVIVRVLHGARDLPALFAPNPADPF